MNVSLLLGDLNYPPPNELFFWVHFQTMCGLGHGNGAT